MIFNPLKYYKYKKMYKTIKQSGLFDSKYYLFTYPDIRKQDIDPIKHYILHGAKEGRNPSLYFDADYYLSTYNDIDPDKINPLFHFIVFGSKEDRNPNGSFDTGFYLNSYKDVKENGINPLYHYINYGKKENRVINKRYKEFIDNKKIINKKTKTISIIMPVYNALDDVKKCIDSIYSKKTIDFELIVMDDCSNAETKIHLEKDSKIKDFQLYRNEVNLRFTKNVNRGIKYATGDIVTILNSDTIVTKGWLEKIINCFESNNNIGIVGALSNAASWQSVPLQKDAKTNDWAVNELPNNYTVDDMGKLVEVLSKKEYPRLPSTNGFCFSIKRDVINKIGILDEKTFPTGYGEEDDFCIRTIDSGYEIALADDLYIYHSKSKSYSHELRKKFTKNNQGALERKHGKDRKDLLIENWKNEKFIKKFSKRLINYMKLSTGNKIVVYTAIFGDYDTIKEPDYVHEDVDYVCFTDNKNLKSDVFEIRLVDRIYDNVTKNPRMLKVLSHLFLIDYDYSLWIDGSVKIRGLDFKNLIDGYLENASIALHKHHKRNCIYEEAKACIHHKKDDNNIINKQMKYYKREGYPKKNALVETAQIIRKEDEDVKKLNLYWWSLLDTFSIRDQLSFSFASWKLKIKYGVFSNTQSQDSYFKNFPHIYNLKKNLKNELLYIVVKEKNNNLNIQQTISICEKYGLKYKIANYTNEEIGFSSISVHEFKSELENLKSKTTEKNYWFIDSKFVFSFEEQLHFIANHISKSSSVIFKPIILNTYYEMINKDMNYIALQKISNQNLKKSFLDDLCFIAKEINDELIELLLNDKSIESKKIDNIEQLFLFEVINKNVASQVNIGILPQKHAKSFTGSAFIRLILPLHKFGFEVQFKTLKNINEIKRNKFDLIITHRTALTIDDTNAFLALKDEFCFKLIYDTDDNLLEHYKKQDNFNEIKNIEKLVKNSNLVTVSEKYLLDCYCHLNSNIHLQKNILDSDLFSNNYEKLGDVISILYMGTLTHKEDFEMIQDVLIKVKKLYGIKVEIDIVGIAQENLFDKTYFNIIKPNIEVKNYIDFVDWIKVYKKWHIGLAPLRDTEFNRSKSDIKYLDYSMLGMAGIYSKIGVYDDTIINKENGLIVNNTEQEWFEALTLLVENNELRQNITTNAFNDVSMNRTTNSQENKWLDNIKLVMEYEND